MGINQYNINANLALAPEGWCFGVVRQNVKLSDFTDNEDTTGSLTMTQKIPAGSIVLGTYVHIKEGFSGDTTAVLAVGKSDTEDEFSYGTTLNILSAGIDMEEPEAGERHCESETTVYLTITGAADFSSISAGKMCVEVVYITADQDFGRGYAVRNNY